MKNTYLTLFILFLSITSINAQYDQPELFIGGNAGITTANNSQFVVGIEGELLMPVDTNFKVGVATGFIFGTQTNEVTLPFAVAGRLNADSKFGLGLDIGYGIPINKSSGSLYFRPMLDYKLTYKSKLRFSYTGLNSIGYVNVGIIFDVNLGGNLAIDW